jgi:hypothetical protein
MTRIVIVILSAALLVGCVTEQTVMVRPRAQWERSAAPVKSEFRPGGWQGGSWQAPPTPPNVQRADGSAVSFGVIVATRQKLAEFAQSRGLLQVAPNPREYGQGFTEVYDGQAGRIRIREEEMGRWLEVRVTGRTLTDELRREIDPVPAGQAATSK